MSHLTLRYKGRNESEHTARRRKVKVMRIAEKLTKKQGYTVPEAEVIRMAIDDYKI